MIDVSVVIISWKMKEMLLVMLKSIQQYTHGISYEIIAVDNSPMDGTSEEVKKNFPDVQLITNNKNKGVALARNQAYRAAKGRYVASLDADMALTENSLKTMTEFMDAHPEAGLCGCRLVFPDGTVQPSSRRFPTLTAQVMRRLHFFKFARNSQALSDYEIPDWDRSDIRRIDYIIGACQFIRRSAMKQIGFLDEKFFYGCEDVDYCLRAVKANWKIYHVGSTKIIHYEQRITKKIIFSKLSYLHLKSVIYLYRKYGWKLN
jgi:GT2 family glycosyltransferase